MHNFSIVTDSDLGVISQFITNLEELDVSNPKDDYCVTGVSGGGGAALGITDEGVDLIASKLPHLRKVNLSSNYFISDKSLINLSEKCLNLEEIIVKNCNFVSQTGFAFALQNCQNLNSISVLGMDLVFSPEIDCKSARVQLLRLIAKFARVQPEIHFVLLHAWCGGS